MARLDAADISGVVLGTDEAPRSPADRAPRRKLRIKVVARILLGFIRATRGDVPALRCRKMTAAGCAADREEAAMTIGAFLRGFARAGLAAGLCAMLASAAVAQKQGGSITVGLELDIPGLDPLKVGVYDTAAEMAAALIFDTLTTLDDSGRAVPKLAQSWTHSDDYKTWTYRLRPGVKFHDGTSFNAQAVAFNIMRQKDPNNHCRCAFYVQSTEKVE